VLRDGGTPASVASSAGRSRFLARPARGDLWVRHDYDGGTDQWIESAITNLARLGVAAPETVR
jgi:hypothetical protein